MKYRLMLSDIVGSTFDVAGEHGIEGVRRALRRRDYDPGRHRVQYYCEHSQRWYAIQSVYHLEMCWVDCQCVTG